MTEHRQPAPSFRSARDGDYGATFRSASRRDWALNRCGEWPRSAAAWALTPGAPWGRDDWCRRGVARFPPVDGFCAGGHAVQEAGGEPGVGAAAAGEAELPQFCGGPAGVVDGLIHGIGIDLASPVSLPMWLSSPASCAWWQALIRSCAARRSALVPTMRRYPRCSQTGRGPGSPAVPCGKPGGSAGAADQRYDRTWNAGMIRPQARLPSVAGLHGSPPQLGGRDEQISWATAERTVPDLACAAAVGYSLNPWIDGKEKVYGSIP